MKILMYTGAFLPKIGGAELVVHHLAEGLTCLGVDITVATFYRSDKELERSYNLQRIKTIRGVGRLNKTRKFKRIYEKYKQIKLKQLIQREKPDLIHVHYLYPTGYEMLNIRQKLGLNIPIVVTSHGIDIQKDASINYGYRLNPEIEPKIEFTARNVDKLIAIGSDVYSEYIKLGVERAKIAQIPNPIAFDILTAGSTVTKADMGIQEDMPVVLAVGRNHPKKGFKDLLDIIKIVNEKNLTVKCLIVGEKVPELQAYVEELRIAGNVDLYDTVLPAGVQYQGHHYAVNELIENFFHIADVYAMTSVIESFGLVAIEAMAAGVPVIAKRAKGAEDLVKHNHSGVLIDGDKETFAGQLIDLLQDHQKRLKIGKNGCVEAAKYSRVAVAEQHKNLYRELV